MSFGLVPRESWRGASEALRGFVAVVFSLPAMFQGPLHSAARPLFFIDAPQSWTQPFLLPPSISSSNITTDLEQSLISFQPVIATP